MQITVHNPHGLPTTDYRQLAPLQQNLKDLSQSNHDKLLAVLQTRGFTTPFFVWRDHSGTMWLMDGHQRQRVLLANDMQPYDLPYVEIPAANLTEAKEQLLEITSQYGTLTQEGFDEFAHDLDIPNLNVNFDALPFISDLGGNQDNEGNSEAHAKLADIFLVPPFSVIDTRREEWQERKRGWIDLGIKSEVGRGEDLTLSSSGFLQNEINKAGGGTSVFDPALCEVMYKWFNVEGGSVLDPFAGGSVRGVVAHKMGMPYTGIELRGEQVEANKMNATAIFGNEPTKQKPPMHWRQGDSNVELDGMEGEQFDFIFSCPPYADLEVYSQEAGDLSNMEYKDFIQAYTSIISKAVSKLKPNRFAVFVVGEVRAKGGEYYNFVQDTVQAFTQAGAGYYNEIILVNAVGSLRLRAARQFRAGRKIGKTHQNILVFFKGDSKQIKAEFPELEMPDEGADAAGELDDNVVEL